jgi:aldehyde:ferredoxin oxidoreductase
MVSLRCIHTIGCSPGFSARRHKKSNPATVFKEKVMHGFYNRVLSVNLTELSFEIQTVPKEIYQIYLGGKGLASYLLYTLNPEGVDPLSPENHLIFATGPVSQSQIHGGSRYGVFTKSPQTGFYSEAYAGGKTPEAIDSTGFDAIVIHGACKTPTILSIDPAGAKFHPAGDIKISEEIEENYWLPADRTGAKAVMDSKDIKAVFFTGNQKREWFSNYQLQNLVKDITGQKGLDTDPAKSNGKLIMGKIFCIPDPSSIKNFAGEISSSLENISANVLHSQCDQNSNCFMKCGNATNNGRQNREELEIEDKARLFLDFEDRLTLFDTMILCRFYKDIYTWDHMGTMIQAMTGFSKSHENLKATSDAISTIVRKFNIREGLNPEDDRLPRGLQREFRQTGHDPTKEELENMLLGYYRLKGWDASGVPVQKKYTTLTL